MEDKKPPPSPLILPHKDSGYFPGLSNGAVWAMIAIAVAMLSGIVYAIIMLV